MLPNDFRRTKSHDQDIIQKWYNIWHPRKQSSHKALKNSHSQQKYWPRDAKCHMLLKSIFDECVLVSMNKVGVQRPDPQHARLSV